MLLRAYESDEKCKIPSAKPILMDFASVTVKGLNSYNKWKIIIKRRALFSQRLFFYILGDSVGISYFASSIIISLLLLINLVIFSGESGWWLIMARS